MIDFGADFQRAYDDGYRARDAEIVRCVDCKHGIRAEKSEFLCERWNGSVMEFYDYCSYGERRDGDA